jgi:hypothetical protein
MPKSKTSLPPEPKPEPEHTCSLCDVRKACSPLKTMAIQVAGMYQHLPALIEAVGELKAQKEEHERRIIRVEGAIEDLHTIVREMQTRLPPKP